MATAAPNAPPGPPGPPGSMPPGRPGPCVCTGASSGNHDSGKSWDDCTSAAVLMMPTLALVAAATLSTASTAIAPWPRFTGCATNCFTSSPRSTERFARLSPPPPGKPPPPGPSLTSPVAVLTCTLLGGVVARTTFRLAPCPPPIAKPGAGSLTISGSALAGCRIVNLSLTPCAAAPVAGPAKAAIATESGLA